MERLTKKFLDRSICNASGEVCNQQKSNPKDSTCCCECEINQKMIDKLGAYEDAEEQGLLHKAPLKNGTLIWYFQYGFDEGPYLTSGTYLYGVTEYEIGEFKKDFWLSEEEAEQALAEMKGGQNG